jgi:hypothetical protein
LQHLPTVIAISLVAMLPAVLLDTLPTPPTPDAVVDDVAEGDDEPRHRRSPGEQCPSAICNRIIGELCDVGVLLQDDWMDRYFQCVVSVAGGGPCGGSVQVELEVWAKCFRSRC